MQDYQFFQDMPIDWDHVNVDVSGWNDPAVLESAFDAARPGWTDRVRVMLGVSSKTAGAPPLTADSLTPVDWTYLVRKAALECLMPEEPEYGQTVWREAVEWPTGRAVKSEFDELSVTLIFTARR